MANMCDVRLRAKGFSSENDEDEFKRLFEPAETETVNWLDVYCPSMEYEDGCIEVVCQTGWSVHCSLTDDGIRDKRDGRLSLEDVTKMFGIAMEVYSTENGNGFKEHFFIKDGRVVSEECTAYGCYDCLDSYDDFMQTYGDEIEEGLGEEMSERTWTHCRENDGFVEIGAPSYDWPYLAKEP